MLENMPQMSTSTPVMTSGAGGSGWGGGIGGAALGAAGGALLGGLLGNNMLGGNGGVTVEKSIGDLAAAIPAQTAAVQHDLFMLQSAAADRGYQQTIAFGQAANGIDKDIFLTSNATQRQICDGFNSSNIIALQNKYDNAMQLCNLDHHMEKCCCEQKELIMKMGYDTQLRDAAYKNDTDKQLADIRCMIKDSEKDQVIRQQQAQLAQMSQMFQTKAITDCVKDAFCKTSSTLNQIGVNEQIINPDCKWPPFIPASCCC